MDARREARVTRTVRGVIATDTTTGRVVAWDTVQGLIEMTLRRAGYTITREVTS